MPTSWPIDEAHNAVYASRALPRFEFSDLGDGVFAGRNPLTARDVETLSALGITHLLDLREAKEWAAPRFGLDALEAAQRLGLKRLHLPVVDMGAPTHSTLNAALAFVDEALETPNSKIYIHCRAGMERTAAILIAHHARKHGVDYHSALKALRFKRPILQPLPSQERAVRAFLDSR